jgi:hypothetical protein
MSALLYNLGIMVALIAYKSPFLKVVHKKEIIREEDLHEHVEVIIMKA